MVNVHLQPKQFSLPFSLCPVCRVLSYILLPDHGSRATAPPRGSSLSPRDPLPGRGPLRPGPQTEGGPHQAGGLHADGGAGGAERCWAAVWTRCCVRWSRGRFWKRTSPPPCTSSRPEPSSGPVPSSACCRRCLKVFISVDMRWYENFYFKCMGSRIFSFPKICIGFQNPHRPGSSLYHY